jgi:NDP-sugar pyrophosphorylase family protein
MTYFDLINTGIYVIRSSCLKFLKKNQKMDIPEFFRLLKSKKKKILIYPTYEFWYDIGQKKNYNKAKKHKVNSRNYV